MQYKKIYEEVAKTLYGLIRPGEVKPGDKLDSVQQLTRSGFPKQTTTQILYEEHLAIYEAICQRGVKRARSLMLTHLGNVEEILKIYYQSGAIPSKKFLLT